MAFLDESGVNTNLTRWYGRSKGKKRVVDSAPLNTPKTTTILSSVRADGTTIRKFFSGALNGETFLKYIHEDLAPSLHPWDFVIMGDLRCHKVQGVKEAVKSAGAFVLYLPPYSPDFNPIEMMWSKIKAIFRKLKARTIEALFSAFPYAFHTVSTDDIRNWFIAAGYSQSYLELL